MDLDPLRDPLFGPKSGPPGPLTGSGDPPPQTLSRGLEGVFSSWTPPRGWSRGPSHGGCTRTSIFAYNSTGDGGPDGPPYGGSLGGPGPLYTGNPPPPSGLPPAGARGPYSCTVVLHLLLLLTTTACICLLLRLDDHSGVGCSCSY